MAAVARGLQCAGGVVQGYDARGCVARAAAYTEPELVLLEALLGVQGRGHAVAPHQL
jgi:hypothetical protein